MLKSGYSLKHRWAGERKTTLDISVAPGGPLKARPLTRGPASPDSGLITPAHGHRGSCRAQSQRRTAGPCTGCLLWKNQSHSWRHRRREKGGSHLGDFKTQSRGEMLTGYPAGKESSLFPSAFHRCKKNKTTKEQKKNGEVKCKLAAQRCQKRWHKCDVFVNLLKVNRACLAWNFCNSVQVKI